MNTPDEVIGPINLGNPKKFTILELASLAIELTGSRSRVVHRHDRRMIRDSAAPIFQRPMTRLSQNPHIGKAS